MLASLATVLLPPVYVSARAAGMSVLWAGSVSGIAFLVFVPVIAHILPARIRQGVRWQRALLALWILATLYAGYRIANLSVFELDATRSEYAISPAIRDMDDPVLEKPFYKRHNCYTSYVIGAHLAATGAENIYDPKQYREAKHKTPVHALIGDTLTVDTYQYPPPFLLLPWALHAAGHDFFQTRTFWFTINILLFFTATMALARWIGGNTFGTIWLTCPIVLASQITLLTLQIGNAHFFMISLAVLGMLALETRRCAVGGALLGFAIAAKIFPVVLLAYLFMRRRWRSVLWTGAWMAVYGLTTLAVFGTKPFTAFIDYQLPRLANGDAFWFAREHIGAITKNLSIPGISYKLQHLDLLAGMEPTAVARTLTWLFSALLIGVVLLLARRHRRLSGTPIPASPVANSDASVPTHPDAPSGHRLVMVLSWMALLVLGQMRSPFLPLYGNIAVIWLLALLTPAIGVGLWRVLGVIVLWGMLSVQLPLPIGPPTAALDLGFSLATVTVALVLSLAVVLRQRSITVVPAVCE